MFQLLVGEIGISREEFLYVLRYWEIRAIIKGYRNRAHTAWETARLNAYFVMSAMTDLKKSGIRKDTDLIEYPWEREKVDPDDQPTKEEVERLREIMRQENAKLEKKNGSH